MFLYSFLGKSAAGVKIIFFRSYSVSKQQLRMARHRMAKLFGANVEESWTRCEPEDLENNNLLFD